MGSGSVEAKDAQILGMSKLEGSTKIILT
jgi:hypothetical protein